MVPCKDCLLIPICRNKSYSKLIIDCKLIMGVLYHDKDGPFKMKTEEYDDGLEKLQKTLQPTLWEGYYTSSGYVIYPKKVKYYK